MNPMKLTGHCEEFGQPGLVAFLHGGYGWKLPFPTFGVHLLDIPLMKEMVFQMWFLLTSIGCDFVKFNYCFGGRNIIKVKYPDMTIFNI
jgi:hypothetical protein